jgi:hypothetical protein
MRQQSALIHDALKVTDGEPRDLLRHLLAMADMEVSHQLNAQLKPTDKAA